MSNISAVLGALARRVKPGSALTVLLARGRRETDADPAKILWVNPTRIAHYPPKAVSPILNQVGVVYGGLWDKALLRFETRRRIRSAIEHFRDGTPWIETEYYRNVSRKVAARSKWRGCSDPQELAEFLDRYDRLRDRVVAEGYRLQRDLLAEHPEETHRENNDAPTPELNEIGVSIGRRGQLFWQTRGQHRLIIAQLLELPLVPVQVVARHAAWQRVRERIRTARTPGQLPRRVRGALGHPDLADIVPAQWRPVVIVLPSLSLGGAERVGVELADFLAESGHQVVVVTVRSTEDDFYRLNPRVKRIALAAERSSAHPVAALRSNCTLIRRLRRVLAGRTQATGVYRFQPTAVLSFVDRTNVRVLLAGLGLGLPVIVAERNDLSLRPEAGIWARLRKLTYPLAKAVVVQTERARRSLRHKVPRARRVAVIPNSVPAAVLAAAKSRPAQPTGHARKPSSADRPPITILAVGRLHPQKGFDLLLKAFAELVREREPDGGAAESKRRVAMNNTAPELRLVILGEGPERAELEALRRRLELEHCVELPGAVTDPVPWYQAADVFVLSSRYEGFPNVLLEAMAAGCACVSFDCPAGPREALVHEENGLLVPAEDTEALAAALRKLVSDSTLRHELGTAAASEARTQYCPEKVQGLWRKLIADSTF